MLDTLMNVGAHRIEYFENALESKPSAFGFYIRGEKGTKDIYSRDAKYQLYAGLVLIHEKAAMSNLVGIYVDVDGLENLQRPAYLQFKMDLLSGKFKRVFVHDETALIGVPAADADVRSLFVEAGGFEFIVCRNGECVTLDLLTCINR